MDIPQITTDSIRIRDLDIGPINIWTAPEARIPSVPPIYPVTNMIGVPVVDMPGCVEAHERDDNNQLEIDDPKGVKVYCDAGTPSFNPMDYNKNKLKSLKRRLQCHLLAVRQSRKTPEPAATPKKTPETNKEVPKIECPTKKQAAEEPVGHIFDSGRKEVTGYKLVGTQCIREVRDIPIIEQLHKWNTPSECCYHHWRYCCCCYYICTDC